MEVAAQAARRPAGKVSETFGNPAARQGAYGLLESGDVPSEQVASAMFAASAKRCAAAGFVFCPVDGTSVTLTDWARSKEFGSIGTHRQGRRGLKVLNAMALSPDGVPLGLTSQRWWARSDVRPTMHRDARVPAEKETGRWLDAMKQTRDVLAEYAPKTRCWFQLDREGDAWPIITSADADAHWFTIRASRNRWVFLADGKRTFLRTVLDSQSAVGSYRLEVRPTANRAARKANLITRACSVALDFRDKRTARRFSKTLNVVYVREEGTTPSGEKPIEWILLTNRPVATSAQLEEIIFGYSLRWRIEEFHRTWKSGGCRVEETQLRSMEAVIKWATILAAVAMRIERLKQLSREQPDIPATDEFSAIEIRAIAALRFGKTAKAKLKDKPPTISEVTMWVAQIGGYTGKSSGGPPGSTTLARGLKDVQAAVQALEALA